MRFLKKQRPKIPLLRLLHVETNMSPMQMIDLAIDVVFGGDLTLENRALPFEGTWDYAWEGKMAVIHINIADNKRLLHEYLYGVQ